MSIKILHTADNHIGMKFSLHSSAVKENLVEERFNALKNIVEFGNTEKVNYLVIAGDLFDTTTVKLADIKTIASILNGFEGDAVIIIPGNHDFYESSADSLWIKFRKYANDEKVLVLTEYEVLELGIGEQIVNFYPAACRSKHSAENKIRWIANVQKSMDAIKIGIAHGNVTGLGLDEGDKYFNMTTEELTNAGMDFWLLGHIHVPYPTVSIVGQNPGFFMPGTHTPDGWNRDRPGTCWLIEVGKDKSVNAKLIITSAFRFYDLEKTVNSEADQQRLMQEITNYDAANSLLRMVIDGRLSEDEGKALEYFLENSKPAFLELIVQNDVKLNIDNAYINSNYTEGSLPHKLLSALALEDVEGISLQLANDLIEKLKK